METWFKNRGQDTRPLKPERFSSGKTIFHEGESGNKMYVVKEGEVELSVHGRRCDSRLRKPFISLCVSSPELRGSSRRRSSARFKIFSGSGFMNPPGLFRLHPRLIMA